MNDFSMEERILSEILCKVLNSEYFRALNGKSQIYVSNSEPFDFENITMEKIREINEKSEDLNNNNIDINYVPEDFFELMSYIFSKNVSSENKGKIVCNYLEKNFVNLENPYTTRGIHTLEVAIVSALSSEKFLDRYNVLQTLAIGLFHDIGHYPFAHTMEDVVESLAEALGLNPKDFSHEKIGAELMERLLKEYEKDIIDSLVEDGYDGKKVKIQMKKICDDIKLGILSHSTGRFKHTPNSVPAQGVRVGDKLAYAFMDLFDLMRQLAIDDKGEIVLSPAIYPNQIRQKMLNCVDEIMQNVYKETGEYPARSKVEESIKVMLEEFEKSPVKAMIYCVEKLRQKYVENPETDELKIKVRMPDTDWEVFKKFKDITSQLRKEGLINKNEPALKKQINVVLLSSLYNSYEGKQGELKGKSIEEKVESIESMNPEEKKKFLYDFLINNFSLHMDKSFFELFKAFFTRMKLSAEAKNFPLQKFDIRYFWEQAKY